MRAQATLRRYITIVHKSITQDILNRRNTMNLKMVAAGLTLVLILGARSLTAAPIAHAGLVVGTPVPPTELGPTVQVAQATHLHCTYHSDGYETCYVTQTLAVTGTRFSFAGGVVIYLKNPKTGAIVAHPQTTASHLSLGYGATFELDTKHTYCTPHGWLVQALDLTSDRYSNVVTVNACSAP
jgi:hypothetical protein